MPLILLTILGQTLLIAWPLSHRADLRRDFLWSPRHAFGMRCFDGRILFCHWHLTRDPDFLAYVRRTVSDDVRFLCTRAASPEERRMLSAPTSADASQKRWGLLRESMPRVTPAWAIELDGRRNGQVSHLLGMPTTYAIAPIPAVSGALVMWPIAAAARGVVRRRRRKWLGQCRHCGYDLRGAVSSVCAECGAGRNGPDLAGHAIIEGTCAE
jgi:hypothetical protein